VAGRLNGLLLGSVASSLGMAGQGMVKIVTALGALYG
jgi:hypothetical protein